VQPCPLNKELTSGNTHHTTPELKSVRIEEYELLVNMHCSSKPARLPTTVHAGIYLWRIVGLVHNKNDLQWRKTVNKAVKAVKAVKAHR
jgi:hypothetical protein